VSVICNPEASIESEDTPDYTVNDTIVSDSKSEAIQHITVSNQNLAIEDILYLPG
jgi:hypothetical protein